MAARLDLTVRLEGGFFHKKIGDVVRRATLNEAIEKMAARFERGGRGLGAQRNTVRTHPREQNLSSRTTTTRRPPRVTGKSWQAYNQAAGRKMAPFVLRKAAKRIVQELD